MLLLFSTGLAALPLLLLAPIILIQCGGCCKKKQKKKPPPKPKQPQGTRPTGMPPTPVKQQGKPATAQQPTTQIQQPVMAQPQQFITVPPAQPGGTPTIFLMQPPTQPGGQPTLIQMPTELVSTMQPAAPVQGPTATAMPSADEKQVSPPTTKDEPPPTAGDEYDNIDDIATAIIHEGKKSASGSKRAATEPEQPVEKRSEGMADEGAEQYQTLAGLDPNLFTEKK